MNLPAELALYRQRLEHQLETILSGPNEQASSLNSAMRYATLNHGKRLRPILVYAAGDAFGATLAHCDAAACAVELIHSYSLVHDDLPAMDNDDLRHGKASCHIAYDEATAILVGDALQALAFQILSNQSDLAVEQRLLMIDELSQACGAQGMAGGQMLDIAAPATTQTIESIETIHCLKTGALLIACAKLGALAAGVTEPQPLQILTEYAHNLGLAFQIQDDILDVECSSAEIGKPQGSDQIMNKPTYTSIAGLNTAKQRVKTLYAHAFTLLDQLGDNVSTLKSVTSVLQNRSF